MIIITVIFYYIYELFSRKIQNNSIRNAFLIFVLLWLFPLFIYQLLPFELSISINYLLVFTLLFILNLVIYKSFIKISSKLIVNFEIKSPFIFIIFAYIGCIILYTDLYIFRGLSLVNPFENREKYSDYSVTNLTYLWLLFVPFSIFNMVFNINNLKFFKKINIILPLILTSLLFLFSGNRQFVFFISLYFAYKFILNNENTKFNQILIILLPYVVILGLLFFTVQIFRQQGTEGSQLIYLLTITGIKCDSEYLCDDPLLTLPLAYIFNYFGNIYHGLSLFVDNNFSVPFGSLSVPLVYRRLSDIFNLQSHSSILADLDYRVEYITGYFPAFWKSMFASFYAEGGIFYSVIILFLIYYSFTKLCIQSNKYVSKNILAFNLSFISFGLMFPPMAEPFLFITYFYVMLYIKIFRKQFFILN